MAGYRLTHAAQADIVAILAWTDEQFGEEARSRYQTLIATAIRDAFSPISDVGHTPRPELGDDVFSWHLAQSRTHTSGKAAGRPRHFLPCPRKATWSSSAGSSMRQWSRDDPRARATTGTRRDFCR
jgi:toxin ParE1/3/4